MKKLKGIISTALSAIILTSLSVPVMADVSAMSRSELTGNDLVSTPAEMSQGIYKFEYTDVVGEEKVTTDVTYIVKDEEDKAEINSFIRQRVDNNYKTKLDSTMSYEHHTQVYYVENGSMVRLTKVTGGYTRRDSTVSVVGQKLVIGQSTLIKSNVTTKYPSSSSWSYTLNWAAVDVTPGAVIGARHELTLKRNAGSWVSELSNNIYDNIVAPWSYVNI